MTILQIVGIYNQVYQGRGDDGNIMMGSDSVRVFSQAVREVAGLPSVNTKHQTHHHNSLNLSAGQEDRIFRQIGMLMRFRLTVSPGLRCCSVCSSLFGLLSSGLPTSNNFCIKEFPHRLNYRVSLKKMGISVSGSFTCV